MVVVWSKSTFIIGLFCILLDIANAKTIDHGAALIEWLRSKGGFVSEKIEIRRVDPNDPTSVMGVFAKADIEEEEKVLHVPKNCYLGLQEDEVTGKKDVYEVEDVTMEKVMQVYFSDLCRLTHKLLDETQKWRESPETSDFGPFLSYLSTQPLGALPGTYSDAGKELLRKIQGPLPKGTTTTAATVSDNYGFFSLPPWQLVDWVEENFIATGCIDSASEEQMLAAQLTVQRGYDSVLIPIWDMFNHHNEELNLDNSPIHDDEGIVVWALGDIAAGKELFATYNYCTDCYDVGDEWGTAGVYRDFGFVEELPQVWPFLDHDIYYEVERNEKTGKIEAIFSEDETTGELECIPDEEGLAYLRRELSRVSALDLGEETEGSDLPQHELQMITKYHESLIVALTVGIEATMKITHNLPREEL